MSILITTQVWQRAPYTGARLLVLLALADSASDEGYSWPKVATIAHKARIKERACQKHIAALICDGWVTRLARFEGDENNLQRSNLYRVTPPCTDTQGVYAETGGGVRTDTQGVYAETPRTVIEPSMNHHRTSLARSAENAADGRADRAQKKAMDQEAMKRDPLYGAFVRSLNYEPQTRQAWDEWRIGMNELNRLQATPQDVYRAVRAFYDRFPHATCTVRATVKWWAALKEGKSHDIAKLEASQRASESSRAEERQRIEQQQRDADRLRAELERDIANGVL